MKKIFFIIISFAFPAISFAQAGPNDLQETAKMFYNTSVNLLIPLAFSAGVFFFMWRGAVYIFSSGSEEAKTEGRRVLTFGVIALFAMASIWGIIRFFSDDFIGVSPSEYQHPPTLNRSPK